MSTAPQSASSRFAPPKPVVLRAWPLRDEPRWAWSLAAAWVGVGLVAAGASGKWGLGGLTTGVLTLASWRWFLPQTFEVSHLGVIQRVLGRSRRMSWSAVQRAVPQPGGVALLPRTSASPLDWTGALFLPAGAQRQELLRVVEFYLAGSSSSVSNLVRE